MNHEPISRAEPGSAAADRRTGVGGLLRASRLRCGEELDVIAGVLRIRRRHLQAIEDGQFDELPGTTYAVGFIRAYADYLGLDAEEVVRRFKEEQTLQPGRPPKADLVFPSPMSETGIPRGAVVFLGVLIGVIAYGGWYSSTVDNDFFKEWIEPVPARLAAMLPSRGGDEAPNRSQAVAADKPASDETQAMSGDQTARDGNSVVSMADATTKQTPETTSEPAAITSETMTRADVPVAEAASEGTAEATTEQAASEAAPISEAPASIPVPEQTAEVTTTSGAPAVAEPAEDTPTETTTVKPPESIAQPVETAQLPAPEAATAGEPAAQETPGADTTQSIVRTATEQSGEQAGTETTPTATTAADTEQSATTEVASAAVDEVDARIVLTAVSDSWVEVREMGTDTWVWGKLMRAGETYPVPDRPDLKMKTGDAGALEITVDGDAVPSVGGRGDVVRNVLLDPERLKSGTAVFR